MNVMIPGIPAKVQTAQNFLWYCYNIETPSDDYTDGGRELDSKEFMVYRSALDVLHLYFLGEEDYAPPVVELEPPRVMTPTGAFVAVPRL